MTKTLTDVVKGVIHKSKHDNVFLMANEIAAAVLAHARPQIEAEARTFMVEQVKQALQVVLRNEVMSKHASLKDCQFARSGIVKSIAAIEALVALPLTHQVVPVELIAEFSDCVERMDRTRGILMHDSGGNWGMLDTNKAKAMLAASKGDA